MNKDAEFSKAIHNLLDAGLIVIEQDANGEIVIGLAPEVK